MNFLGTTSILIAAYLAVFFQACYPGFRHVFGVQPDLLPVLAVYAGLTSDLGTVVALSLVGGLGFDALSANPLGTTVLPLFLIGFTLHCKRDLLLRDQPYAHFVLGLMASAAAPVISLVILLAVGQKPLTGLGSIWQWIVISMEGAVLTPVCFWVFHRIHHAFQYQARVESTFRPDREIKRGRG